ncbi:pilus assembly protein PilQ [Thiohalocapsa halophila]|uniref:Pilus assembly protein PilQ n=1 Tax=Thiohalocapsa halophila TaxID=69359 RepID=A0ABS1CNU7_9GAMM|nr:type IV pilus secretin PilQ [Thiohalocapsa halophila]MBK1633041.1 pilus assembly protein PilQ [Thiohalocapsa halophila]
MCPTICPEAPARALRHRQGPGARALLRAIPALALWLALAWTVSAGAAVLQDVEFASLPGNQVEIDLVFSGSAPAPEDFATENPARIAIDFPGASSGLDRKSVPIGLGVAHSLVAIEASDRTRVVINLNDSVPYELNSRGNRVTVSLNPDRPAPPPTQARRIGTQGTARPAQRQAPRGAVKDIDFRRGAGGEGRVLITLPSADTKVSVRQEGQDVIVDIPNTDLPQRLFRRLDVVDFATPVTAVESRGIGGDVRVDVKTADQFEYLAYQTDNLFTLEFRALTPAEREQREREKIVYDGDRLSLNFQDIEVRAVLQLLADFTGLNLVASDTVRGNITLRLKNVPWDQALDIILKTKGLSMRQTGNVIMVAPTQEIAAQEKLELESKRQIQELAPVRSEFIQVNYAKAADFAVLLKSEENNLLTPDRGSVTVDARTNTLLVQDTAAKLEEVRRLVNRLDVPVRQVMIESRVVIANDDFARDLGVRFGLSTSMGQFRDNELLISGGRPNNSGGGPFSTFNAGPFGQTVEQETGPDGNTIFPPFNSVVEFPEGSNNPSLMVNLPANANPAGAFNFMLGKVGSHLIQLELSAMQREGRGEVVSSPRVVTSDQNEAVIKVGTEIPYQEQTGGAGGGTAVAFKEAVLKLQVTPHITPDDRVIMDLEVNKDQPNFANTVLGVPPVDTRSVSTSVLVDNGETVVLGGVYERDKTFAKEQVPWLGDVPVFGRLFKNEQRQDNNSELLIFVTPKILKGELATR